MKLMSQILSLFFYSSLSISAVAIDETTIDWGSAKEIKSLIELKLHPQNGEVSQGPNFAVSDKSLSDDFSEIYLARVIDPEDEEFYILFITAHHNDPHWRTYNVATKKDGSKLSIATLSKNRDVSVNDVTYKYEERLAVTLTFIDFADSSTAGLDLTISGKKSNQIIIPSVYFLAMLQSM